MVHTAEIDLGSCKISIETGKVAKQANGAVVVRSGDSVVLVSACMSAEPKAGVTFFPLTVDYREYTYAAGKIPGGYIKREGRPTEKEILTSRLIDRPIRPLFPEGFNHETQVIGMVLSADPEINPDTLAMVGAGAALAVSDIPFPEIIGAVRVGLVNGELIANPTYEQVRVAKLNIVVAGTDEGIVMVEAGANGASEAEVLQAIEFGHECCRKIIAGIRDLAARAGKPKFAFTPPEINKEMYDSIAAQYREELTDALDTQKYPKLESYQRVEALKKKALEVYTEEQQPDAAKAFDALKERIFRDQILNDKRRPDGRAFDEIRPISIEVGTLPRTHGSALFTRGETQALVTVTLGTKEDEQRLELLESGAETSKRFMLHYNFPPFSVGEVGFLRGPGRREIGHGALAERALSAVIPEESVFPYTMRVVSDILESNGSSSMASVCGATLALMDAGVPISAPVAGIAMGMVKEGDRYAVLTDIAGAEDHYGDMDFKVAGTREGITALQMDIKVPNVTTAVMKEALEQACRGRLFILNKMEEVLAAPRTTLSPYAPRIYTMTIPTDKIRELIGPGGKVIRGIIDQTGVKIDVEDDGTVHIFSADEASAAKAQQMVSDIAAVAEVGKTYLGKVVRLVDFGAFVEIFPGTDGLLHISEISENRIKNVRDELREGDQILVKVLALEGNKIKLSRKAVLREQREKLKSAKK
ncbi:MAG TPA: polyribonucleotide nucleotidyltransferase [Bryobacteraceae bacterium]|nr:polyribonucleotide nucleotidyltransferase [Bryobacteraceae bacterium]HOQ44050.1 polyribonucleotide nucleotidyltransferase [Bryobacteraceae bacterium]HPQ15005.1 polyribonucleotide nucleotidyltransferase [Bryobacteraceae bacterium]HPU70368.1 polyribonucleotide nucleotidyltransferase [Bryobacteraceae bacterium]